MDLLNLKALWFEPEQQQLFENALIRPYGLILSPVRRGAENTTLYAGLNKSSSDINIVTIEDPWNTNHGVNRCR